MTRKGEEGTGPTGRSTPGPDHVTRLRPESEVRTGRARALETRYPAGLRLDRHHHDRASLTLVLEGRVLERTEDGVHRAGPGSVVMKPAGTEHANRFGDSGARTLLLDVEGDARLREREWRWTDGGPPARAMLRVLEALRLWPEDLDSVVDEVLAEMPSLLDGRPGSGEGPPGWIRQVRRRLEEELRDPPLVRHLAAEADVHPTYLTRRFKRAYGSTVTGYVRHLRVQEAVRRMSDSASSLGRVALEAGFADHSHMCRVFRRETGLTPGRYRELL
ncbi:MAG: helix-turn-helix domain-containing protein [Candidatus Palauibacterales bacterium]|nr:helix-turn-helix domain-containing protein [Candidatus Palauibacterales bacterium]